MSVSLNLYPFSSKIHLIHHVTIYINSHYLVPIYIHLILVHVYTSHKLISVSLNLCPFSSKIHLIHHVTIYIT